MDPLDRAINHFGSQKLLAKAIGLKSGMAVSQWKKRGVPPQRCVAIEQATGGVVCAVDLRPDIFGASTDQSLSEQQNEGVKKEQLSGAPGRKAA